MNSTLPFTGALWALPVLFVVQGASPNSQVLATDDSRGTLLRPGNSPSISAGWPPLGRNANSDLLGSTFNRHPSQALSDTRQPFVCETQANGLGMALDADCNAPVTVNYFYKPAFEDSSVGPSNPGPAGNHVGIPDGFKHYHSAVPTTAVAQTTVSNGARQPYIVRQELGVINRAVYQILLLHRPGTHLPDRMRLRTGEWNGRLVYTFQGGCGPGHHQGKLSPMDRYERILAQGYALATSSLNALGNNCDDQLSARTASMVKDYFSRRFGRPEFTIGVGGSSGGVALYLTAQNFPGVLDGLIPYFSASDHITNVIPVFSDCALISNALNRSRHSWTERQKALVSGFAHWETCGETDKQFAELGWLDPSKCHASVPKSRVFDRVRNLNGLRCSYFDTVVNVFGRNDDTGNARRTVDNEGIQYGLVALLSGDIDADKFIELNALIGGFDDDGNIVPDRSVADPIALRRAYDMGALFTGKGVGALPIVDWTVYVDDLPDPHTSDRPFITRDRLIAANGDAGNQAILIMPRPPTSDPSKFEFELEVRNKLGLLANSMDRWLSDVAKDHSGGGWRDKILRHRPSELSDGCFGLRGQRFSGASVFDVDGQCTRLYPRYGNPRVAAGMPRAAGILKCKRIPVRAFNYHGRLTTAQVSQLEAIFKEGVCDYSRPGESQDGV